MWEPDLLKLKKYRKQLNTFLKHTDICYNIFEALIHLSLQLTYNSGIIICI